MLFASTKGEEISDAINRDVSMFLRKFVMGGTVHPDVKKRHTAIIDMLNKMKSNHKDDKELCRRIDEELEDDISLAIAKHLERIISNTVHGPSALKDIATLKDDFGLINYRSRQILARANELLKPATSCRENIKNNMLFNFFCEYKFYQSCTGRY